MAVFKNIITFFILCGLLDISLGQVAQGGPHESQTHPHQNQGRARRQVSQFGQDNLQNWTTCDFTAISKISCHDCSTRIICKPIGGLLKPCNNPGRPYCNNGICSAIPNIACE